MALSISPGVGAEIPVPDVARSDRQRGAKVRDDVLSAAWLRDCGGERPGRPCALAAEGAAEVVDIGADGGPERTYRDSTVQHISEFAKEAVLGESFLGERILRRYGRTQQ